MKRLLIAAALTLALPVAALAASNSPLSAAYRAIYCYPGGSYWASQVSHYPTYYSAHNAYYVSHYGAATRYCPV